MNTAAVTVTTPGCGDACGGGNASTGELKISQGIVQTGGAISVTTHEQALLLLALACAGAGWLLLKGSSTRKARNNG
jgi:hypothetical protein